MKISTEKNECKLQIIIQDQVFPLDKNAFNTTGVSYELHLNSLQCMFTGFFHFSRSSAKGVKVVLLLKNIQLTCYSSINRLGTVQEWQLGKRTENNFLLSLQLHFAPCYPFKRTKKLLCRPVHLPVTSSNTPPASVIMIPAPAISQQ